MLNLPNNINGNERLARIIIGALLLIGLLIGLGKVIAFLIGIILIAEGIVGWCAIPVLDEKLKLSSMFNKKE